MTDENNSTYLPDGIETSTVPNANRMWDDQAQDLYPITDYDKQNDTVTIVKYGSDEITIENSTDQDRYWPVRVESIPE